MTPRVISHTRDDLIARRASLLKQLGVLDVAEARDRAERDELSGEQGLLLDELGNVEFLLGSNKE